MLSRRAGVAAIFFPVLFSLAASTLFLVSADAQNSSATPDSVGDYVRSEMQTQYIPGLSLLVSKGGQVVRAEGFGLANVELQAPVKAETVFQSGSVGKQFTATAVMMLVEEGKVALDDPLTKYFSDAPASWKEVTVRQLLSHTAGFTDYPEKFDFRKDWNEVGLQQPRVPHVGHSDSPRDGRILRRLSAAAHLSAAGNADYPNHQRS